MNFQLQNIARIAQAILGMFELILMHSTWCLEFQLHYVYIENNVVKIVGIKRIYNKIRIVLVALVVYTFVCLICYVYLWSENGIVLSIPNRQSLLFNFFFHLFIPTWMLWIHTFLAVLWLKWCHTRLPNSAILSFEA